MSFLDAEFFEKLMEIAEIASKRGGIHGPFVLSWFDPETGKLCSEEFYAEDAP